MYLKEIKLSGFKSFADRLNIELNNGITCVVGPNGSGKSNIVDAVRWVLGEQSVKSLRGDGAMSDVIFAGSKSRNSLNVASVTLIFDNQDKHLPIDYSEVSIKRRVYAGGENEYFLNGEKCRLKDVIDLFVDSGSGKGSFNIISQGEIAQIIGVRPEERRIIFEEAAGVLKYKRRKIEATRKIERAHDNLNRVNDIISELEVQINPLKEQSEKAKEYLDAKESLEDIEISLIVHDIDNINYEYQETKTKIDTLNKEIMEVSTQSSSDEADLEKDKLELQKLDKNIYDLQQQLIDISSKVEKISGQREMLKERQKYSADDNKVHDNVIRLKETELGLKNKIHALETDISNNKEQIELLNKETEEIESNINKIKGLKVNHINKLDMSNREVLELKHKIELLRNQIDNNSSLSYSVRSVLNNPKLNGIHGVIGKLLEVDEEYALAIETCLGPSMQFIVVDNEIRAKEAVTYLKNNSLGRATFFPINIIKPRGIDPDTLFKIKNHPDFIDVASNLVQFDSKYRNIFLNQLGNVIITKDLDSANEIGRLIDHRYRIVTLDGELLHVGGSITGGSSKKNNGMIKEKYELEAMLRKVVVSEEEIKTLELKIKDTDKEIQTLETKLFNVKSSRISSLEINNNKLINNNELNTKLEQITNELETLEGVINNTLSDEEKQIMETYYKTLEERDHLNKEIERLNNQKSTLKSKIDDLDGSIRKYNSNYYKKQDELKNMEIKSNRMDVKLDSLLNHLTEEYSMTYETAKHNYKLELDVDEARIKVNVAKDKIKKLGIVNLGAIEEYERVNKRYEFLSKQREDLTRAEDTLLDIIKEMDSVMKQDFMETFKKIQKEFKVVFRQLFNGGTAELKLTDPSNILETGIDIVVSPPGKKLEHLSLLSGGEKSLTAIALLFAILNTKVVPFCLFDEVEAALDEANVASFGEYLKTYKDKTQFIIITHQKKTMEYANLLYGITMQESGVSKLVSVKLEDVNEYIEA
ncbi:MAG: chromosome segregation protein SMC [Bacilli bacterium]|nr:chromosome segregation protein SMC [Bacilli bacterium]